MKKLILLLGLTILALLPLSVGAQEGTAPRLTPGNLVTGSLDASSFATTYIFIGSAGDTVNLSATTTDNGFTLAMLVTGPGGSLVAQDGDMSVPGAATVTNLELPEDGTYTVTILRGEGATGDSKGDFSLILTGTLTPPAAATTAPVAQSTTDPSQERPPQQQATPTTAPVTQPTATTAPVVQPTATTAAPSVPEPGSQQVTLTNGGISIGLSWSAAVNLDLEVRDPAGNSLFFNSPSTPEGGAFSGDINGDCDTAASQNLTEAALWSPGTVWAGSYEIIIYYQNDCDVGGPQAFSLVGTANGATVQVINGTLNPDQQYLANLTLDTSANWTLNNGGVNGGLNLSLLSQQISAAQPLSGNSASGTITRQRPAFAYTFSGTANDPISAAITATSGNLDTYLVLLGPSGEEIASNDDRDDTTTNSTISTTLQTTGTHTLVATRFGQTIGGTEGSFQLTLTRPGDLVTQGTPQAPVAGGQVPTIDIPPINTSPGGQSPVVAGLPQGSIEIALQWDTLSDVQLLVRDPAGIALYDDAPQISSGGTLFEDGNVRCTGVPGIRPISYAYWPQSLLPPGIYEIEIWHQDNCNDPSPVAFDLSVEINGQQLVNTTDQPLPLNSRYMITFQVTSEGSEVFSGGIFDMTNVTSTINYFDRLGTAIPISYGSTLSGNITLDERFQIYSFQGQIGDTVQISMVKTGGTLDPAIYLLSQQGIQLAFNDDVPNQTGDQRDTNSLLEGIQLTQTGTYYIIATHYGQEYGGTTGSYTLTVFGGAQ